MNVERSKKTGRWVKGTSASGTCFTISYDNFEEFLKSGRLPYTSWRLKAGECVERFVAGENGVTVYIGNVKNLGSVR
jgi:hypothetical protein